MIYFPGTINIVSTQLYCHDYIHQYRFILHLPAVHITLLCACWHSEAVKGSSSLSTRRLLISLWVMSSLFLCPEPTDAPCPYYEDPAPLSPKWRPHPQGPHTLPFQDPRQLGSPFWRLALPPPRLTYLSAYLTLHSTLFFLAGTIISFLHPLLYDSQTVYYVQCLQDHISDLFCFLLMFTLSFHASTYLARLKYFGYPFSHVFCLLIFSDILAIPFSYPLCSILMVPQSILALIYLRSTLLYAFYFHRPFLNHSALY
jgi:hypothetical protein